MKNPIKKTPMSEDKLYPILKSAHIIGVLSTCIEIEHSTSIFDVKFKQPHLNNASRKIKESCEQISNDLAFQFKLKDRDKMLYEESAAIYRIISHFIELGTEKSTEFIDLVDKMKLEGTLKTD